MIPTLLKVQKSGGGRYSINTILVYNEYYMQYKYYITRGASKMEAYEWAGEDAGIGSQTIMEAVRVISKLYK